MILHVVAYYHSRLSIQLYRIHAHQISTVDGSANQLKAQMSEAYRMLYHLAVYCHDNYVPMLYTTAKHIITPTFCKVRQIQSDYVIEMLLADDVRQ